MEAFWLLVKTMVLEIILKKLECISKSNQGYTLQNHAIIASKSFLYVQSSNTTNKSKLHAQKIKSRINSETPATTQFSIFCHLICYKNL